MYISVVIWLVGAVLYCIFLYFNPNIDFKFETLLYTMKQIIFMERLSQFC